MISLCFEKLWPVVFISLFWTLPARASVAQSDTSPLSNETPLVLPNSTANHRLYIGAGVAPSALILGNVSLHGWRFDAHLGYGYRALRGLELGADVAIYPDNLVLLPSAYIRPYVPLAGDRFELGFNARAGLLLVPDTYPKIGGSYGVGLDARMWLTKNMALQLSTEGVIAKGPHRESPFLEESGQVVFLAIDTSLAAVLRF